MSDIKNPVSKDPYGKVNSPTPIAPIEKDKKDKNKFDEANNSFENEENAKSFIYGTLLSFINEILKNTPKQPQISNNALYNTLKITCQKLIELFSNLIKQDHSHDPKFYHELSEKFKITQR